MRTRALAALLLLLLPLSAEAQFRRGGRIGTRVGPPRDEPNPPQPAGIARELSYYRLPYSVESFPVIAHFDAAGYLSPGVTYGWTSGGVGSLAQLRVARGVSLVLNTMYSRWGGPMQTASMEAGTRLGPQRGEHRLSPFLDLRAGYLAGFASGARMYDVIEGSNPSSTYGNGNWDDGVGGVAGLGAEFGLTRTLSLTGSASMMKTRMQRHELLTTSPGPSSYRMTSYRYILALKWNPVRFHQVLAQEALPEKQR